MINWNIEELALPQSFDPDAVELLPLFSAELRRSVMSFQDVSERLDLAEVARLCHRMQGSAALYGFIKFSQSLLDAAGEIKAGQLAPKELADGLSAVADSIGRLAASPSLLSLAQYPP